MGGPVHSGSLGSFRRAHGVVGFIWVPWVHSGAPMGSSGSLAFIGFILARPVGRQGHSRSLDSVGRALGSFGCTLGFVGFIRVHALWVDGIIRVLGLINARLWDRRVHSGAPWV